MEQQNGHDPIDSRKTLQKVRHDKNMYVENAPSINLIANTKWRSTSLFSPRKAEKQTKNSKD